MKYLSIFAVCFSALLAVSCSTGSRVAVRAEAAAFDGVYVSDGYQSRAEGYDWVVVTLNAESDSTSTIKVRSRADKKMPTCRFDGVATVAGRDTLVCDYLGKKIILVMSDSTLLITTPQGIDNPMLHYFCSGGASMGGKYKKIDGVVDMSQADSRDYVKVLNSANRYFFDVVAENDTLTITPSGFSEDNTPVNHTVAGFDVVGAETADLNGDGFPEAFVYLSSRGSNRYGEVIGYSSNNGKSMSSIAVPELSEKAEYAKGYNGGDEFAVVEMTLCRRFPIYDMSGDTPVATGKIRQIQYKLTDGEACRSLAADKIVEF